jgi:hypothetical protein
VSESRQDERPVASQQQAANTGGRAAGSDESTDLMAAEPGYHACRDGDWVPRAAPISVATRLVGGSWTSRYLELNRIEAVLADKALVTNDVLRDLDAVIDAAAASRDSRDWRLTLPRASQLLRRARQS